MKKKVQERAVAWPVFKGDEMAFAVAFFETLGGSYQ